MEKLIIHAVIGARDFDNYGPLNSLYSKTRITQKLA